MMDLFEEYKDHADVEASIRLFQEIIERGDSKGAIMHLRSLKNVSRQ